MMVEQLRVSNVTPSFAPRCGREMVSGGKAKILRIDKQCSALHVEGTIEWQNQLSLATDFSFSPLRFHEASCNRTRGQGIEGKQYWSRALSKSFSRVGIYSI